MEAYRPASTDKGKCEALQPRPLSHLQHRFLHDERLFRLVLGQANVRHCRFVRRVGQVGLIWSFGETWSRFRMNCDRGLAKPVLLRGFGILVHIFTSTYKVTTSNHAARPMLSLSLDIISYMELRP